MQKARSTATLDGLQMLRGLAALAVFASHLVLKGQRFGAAIIPHGASLGVYGVDIFFVISGFIMVRSTAQRGAGPRAAGGLLVQRFGRIFPPYWVALFICMGVEAAAPGAITAGPHAPLVASLLLTPASSTPILRSAWTLVHEVYFYLAFALLMLLPRRSLTPGLLVWAGLVLLAQPTGLRLLGSLAALIAHPLTFEFILGAALALVTSRATESRPFSNHVVVWTGLASSLAFLAGAIISIRSGASFPDPETARVLMVGLPAAGIVFAAASMKEISGGAAAKFLLWLGDRSYALYLVNLPLSAIAAALVMRVMGGGALATVVYGGVAITAVALATLALHSCVERPAMRWSKSLSLRLFGPGPRVAKTPAGLRWA